MCIRDRPHKAAGPCRFGEALRVRHDRRLNGRVLRLLAVRRDDDRLDPGAVRHQDRVNGRDLAGHAGVDVGADKAARFSHDRSHKDVVALLDTRRAGRADVLLHGQDDLLRQRELPRGLIGRVFAVRHMRALRAAFEFFPHNVTLLLLYVSCKNPRCCAPLLRWAANSKNHRSRRVVRRRRCASTLLFYHD